MLLSAGGFAVPPTSLLGDFGGRRDSTSWMGPFSFGDMGRIETESAMAMPCTAAPEVIAILVLTKYRMSRHFNIAVFKYTRVHCRSFERDGQLNVDWSLKITYLRYNQVEWCR